jgi:outer membrane protein
VSFLALLFCLAVPDTLDLTVEQALSTARQQSPAAASAVLDRRAGQSQYLRAWSAAVPQLSGSGSLGWRFGDSTTQALSASLGVNQALFAPSVIGGIAIGVLNRRIAGLRADDKLGQQAYNVRIGYCGLQKAYGLYDLARTGVQQAEDNEGLVRQKRKMGSATQIDVMRSEANQHQARLDLMHAEQNLLSANEGLKALMGTAADVIIRPTTIDTICPVPVCASQESLWQQVAEANPTLNIARQNTEVARLDRVVAYGKLLPTFSASVQSGTGAASLSSSWSELHDNVSTSFGISLNLPILDIAGTAFDIHDANIALERARVSQRSSELEVRRAAADAFLSYQQATRQVSYANENLSLNRELYRQAIEQYQLGQLTVLDLFSVEAALTQARVSYLNALSDIEIQQAQIDYLLGK